MISVIISKQDFEDQFKIIDDKTAEAHGGNETKSVSSPRQESKTKTERTGKYFRAKIKQRQDMDRKIDQALRRYKQRTIL